MQWVCCIHFITDKKDCRFILGALVIERPASIDEGFSQEAPLVYHFGHKSPAENTTLYSMLVEKLSLTVKERLDVNKKSK